MTLFAVFLGVRIGRFLPVMAFPAEVAPVDPAHIHLVRSLGHLEYLIVTLSALEAFFVHMFIMTKDDGSCVFRHEG
jgi:hypothetical protein